jgi:uncharacterized protein (DUF952 family)
LALIFKICPRELWRTAERERAFRGAPVDLRDGYIHFSTAAQLSATKYPAPACCSRTSMARLIQPRCNG